MRILAVTNMYPTSQAPASGTFVEQQVGSLKQVGLEVDVLFVDRRRKGMGAYLSLRREIGASVMKFQPDLVHVMYGGVMAYQVTCAIRDRPIVVSFCGSDLLGENLSGPLRKLIARYGVFSSHRAARRAWGIVAKSKSLQDVLPKDVDRSKIRIIPNGIDLERFRPLDRYTCRGQLGWSPDHFHILFPTNSGDPVKRFDLAQAAVETVNRLGTPAEIHQLRGVNHNEVPVWLNASDAVLLTSLHEGSPNVIKEALACDIPVVSVDVGDVRERIQGIAGCYLASPEVGDLAAKLRLVDTGPRRVAGRIRMQVLSLECIARRLKRFYEEILMSHEKWLPVRAHNQSRLVVYK